MALLVAPGDSAARSRPQGAEKHPAYHGPASPGSPFHLAAPDNDPLPACTRALIVWVDTTWAEYDPATGEIVAEGKAESGEERHG